VGSVAERPDNARREPEDYLGPADRFRRMGGGSTLNGDEAAFYQRTRTIATPKFQALAEGPN
jgi:hypothetical protein